MTQERKRGFEVITSYQDKAIQLPQRATHHAAGYDLDNLATLGSLTKPSKKVSALPKPSSYLSWRQMATMVGRLPAKGASAPLVITNNRL